MNINSLLEIAIPDPGNLHNYMLDTSAFNRLADNYDDIDLFIYSKSLGFEYYKTANQNYELGGMGANVYDKDCLPTYYKNSEALERKQPLFNEIKKKLNIQRVSSIASLMRNHWVLDGTYRLWDHKSIEGQVVKKILDLHEKKRVRRPFSQHYDAMIAEAALYHKCVLVTNDSDLMDIINETFPGQAISYDSLIRIIKDI